MRTPEWILTVADPAQLNGLIKGTRLKGHPEARIAFVGRSNVGKSSLINQLLGVRLARTSAQPGKTRAIHFYDWPFGKRVIADLPGYGYAKTAKADRNQWETFISSYLKAETHLDRALVLLDARHGPTEVDLQAIDFLSSLRIPITFVFSKWDCVKTQSDRAQRKREAQKALASFGVDDPEGVFWVSIHDPHSIKKLVRAVAFD
jgi:GTP-binding protein